MPVIWYFAPEGAKTFYGLNAFESGIWDRDTPALPPLLGEQPPYASPYYGGANVWGYLGKCMVGTAEQYANGFTHAEILAPRKPIPGCCGLTVEAFGGALCGGIATTTTNNLARPPGGALCGGRARTQHPTRIEPRGGARNGGRARTQHPTRIEPRGGALCGGVSFAFSSTCTVPRGGARNGGRARTQHPTRIEPRGGALCGGLAHASSPSKVAVRGGALCGGLAHASSPSKVAVRGGALCGGLADTSSPSGVDAIGGALCGGLADTSSPSGVDVIGGALCGGLADTSSPSGVDAIGGALCGGLVLPEPNGRTCDTAIPAIMGHTYHETMAAFETLWFYFDWTTETVWHVIIGGLMPPVETDFYTGACSELHLGGIGFGPGCFSGGLSITPGRFFVEVVSSFSAADFTITIDFGDCP